MGKATILSHLGAGKYRVRVAFDNAGVDNRKAYLTTQSSDLATKITDIATEKAEKKATYDAALASMNLYISINTPEEIAKNPTDMNKLTAEVYSAKSLYDLVVMEEKGIKLRKKIVDKDLEYLNKYTPSTIDVDAWCVSYNTSLTGETATIECDYALKRNITSNVPENDTGIWIPATQNQHTTDAPVNIAQHPMATSVHANWFNLCMVPAAQRDALLYRVATISNVNQALSTCDITYDGMATVPSVSSDLVPEFPIYPALSETASGTIVYPPCNGHAFDDGDRVIVKPGHVVIGFYSNPRQCAGFIWSERLGFDADAIPGGVGVPEFASGQGPLSHWVYDWTVVDTPSDPIRRVSTVEWTETDSGFVYTWNYTNGALTLTYEQTYTVSGHSKVVKEQGSTTTMTVVSDVLTKNESITTTLKINGALYGVVAQYDNAVTGSNSNPTRTFTATLSQVAVYSDGTVKAVRHYTGSGTRTNTSRTVSYSRTTTGDLSGITDTDISGTTTTWHPGWTHYEQGPITTPVEYPYPFGTPPYHEERDTYLNSYAFRL